MLLSEYIHAGISALSGDSAVVAYPADEARSILAILCEEKLGFKSYTHVLEPKTEIPQDRLSEMLSYLDRLKNGEPLQYVTGVQEFYGLRFHVAPGVLIPRPETEILVRKAVIEALGRRNSGEPVNVLDLCTGSGCIAWSIAMEAPGSIVTGLDISDAALEIASGQFKTLANGSVAPRFFKGDLLSAEPWADDIRGPYNIIVSNPPYVMESEKPQMRRNVLDWEPDLALFVPDNDPLLFYRAIAHRCTSLLAEGGFGMVEINESLGEQTAELFVESAFKDVKVVKDLAGKDRFVRFRK